MIAFKFQLSTTVVDLFMGSGALIAAMANELLTEEMSREFPAFILVDEGAIVFSIGTILVERRFQARGGGQEHKFTDGKAFIFGTLLDGIPESMALGREA